jgi:GH18 family chitinase
MVFKNITMKNSAYILITLLVIAFTGGCKKGQEAMTDDNFHPRIIDNSGVFTAPSRIIFQGQSAIYSGLTFSPKPIEKTKIVWTVNDKEVSTDTAYTFVPTSGGEYTLKLVATYNGQTSTRISKILVSPDTYTFKKYSNVFMDYLSENGTAAAVDWTKITHLAFNGARVISESSVDFSKGNLNQNADELAARGHINGVPVLLGVSGRLSGIDGWSLYNSTDFGTSISTPAKRATLIALIKTYVVAHKLDGVDVMMTDFNNDVYSISAGNLAAVGPFVKELKAALPVASIVTATVTSNYMHWEYTDLSAVDWVNVHAFENGITIGPGAPRGQSSPLSFMLDAAAIWINKGFPASKIVLGVPAFGLRYNEIDAQGNNLSWGSYDYMSYKDIVAADPSAAQKEYVAGIAKGVYYNGVPLVKEKAQYIKDHAFKGAYLWAGDFDAAGDNSLSATIGTILK